MKYDFKNEECVSEVEKLRGSTWRHVKTHNYYTIRGWCIIENTWSLGIVYSREAMGSYPDIVRDYDEFFDGRFERVEVNR